MPIELREALGTIDAPAARAGFRDRVYELAADRDNRAARRLRVALVVAAVLAAAGISSTAVLGLSSASAAHGTYDKTFSCPIPVFGGAPLFHLAASGDGLQISLPTHVGDRHQLFIAVRGVPNGITVDTHLCTSAPAIPLRRASLPLAGSFGKNGELSYGDGDKCFSGSRIVVRFRAVLQHGRIASGRLAVATGAKLHPFLYASLSGTTLQLWGSDACTPET